MADTMSPAFLHSVAARRVHDAFSDLTRLWKIKVRLAQGHPFDAALDIEEAMLDAITDAAFSAGLGNSNKQHAWLARLSQLDALAKDKDSIAVFPRALAPVITSALRKLADSHKIPMNSPLGYYHHAFALKFYPALRRANATKNRLVEEKLEDAWRRFTTLEHWRTAEEDHIASAADLLVSKEVKLARREGREPAYKSRAVQDELFGFVEAGHDTTGTTIEWGIKFLSKYGEVQNRLRKELKATFPSSVTPPAFELATARLPYFEAFINEVLRVGNTAVSNARIATEDTEIFGYRVPKGTDVFMLVI